MVDKECSKKQETQPRVAIFTSSIESFQMKNWILETMSIRHGNKAQEAAKL